MAPFFFFKFQTLSEKWVCAGTKQPWNEQLGVKKQVSSFTRSSGGGDDGETGKDPHLGFLLPQSPALREQNSVVRVESEYMGTGSHEVSWEDTDPSINSREWAHSHWL